MAELDRVAAPGDTDRSGGTPDRESLHRYRAAGDTADRGSVDVPAIRAAYADLAPWFEHLTVLNRLATGRARARLFGDVDGRVLDVACGTGLNHRYLPDAAAYVGVDVSPAMLSVARARLPPSADLFEMAAESLAFRDDRFDGVVSSLSTCTFPDRSAALRELARVCRPDGRIHLLEHGRTDVPALNRLLSRAAPAHYDHVGCRLDQDPVAVVRAAGLDIESVRTGYLGALTALVVVPSVDDPTR